MATTFATLADAVTEYVSPTLAPDAADYDVETIAREAFIFDKSQQVYVLIADAERWQYIVEQCTLVEDDEPWYDDPYDA